MLQYFYEKAQRCEVLREDYFYGCRLGCGWRIMLNYNIFMIYDDKNALVDFAAALDALDAIGHCVYEDIKNNPLQFTALESRGFNYTGEEEEEEEWAELATKIVHKYAVRDGVRALRFPTGETAQKIVQNTPVMGVALYDDEDTNRYVLPAYYSSFYLALKSNLSYSTICNNIGVLYAGSNVNMKAKKCFEESIRFIPNGVDYPDPYANLEELNKKINFYF